MRAIIFLLIALSLMIFDHHNKTFHRFRSALSYFVLPIQYTVSLPISVVNWVLTDISTHESLLKDNAALHSQLLLLQAKVQKQYAVESENAQLKALLWSSQKSSGKVLEAQLLAIASDPFVNQVVIDKGAQDGVFQGQPVMDSKGVMGQVIQTGAITSRIMLLTDPRSAIPVQDKRNNIRAILVGHGSFNALRLINVTNTTDIQKGDMLVTSGLGQRYPFGYPVGTVVSVNNTSQDKFADIRVMPAAQLNRSRFVLLIWPVKTKIEPVIKQSLKKAKASKGDHDG